MKVWVLHRKLVQEPSDKRDGTERSGKREKDPTSERHKFLKREDKDKEK